MQAAMIRVATVVTLKLVFQMMMMSCLRMLPLVATFDNLAKDDSEADSDPISFLWETTDDAADDDDPSAIRPEVLGCSARKKRNKQSLQKQQQDERSFKDLRLEFLQRQESNDD